jgi:hypothetical protein
VILALAFALSFRALFDVGRAAGLGSLAWALPVIVDGFAILAARVIERLQSRWARLYPWTLLVGLVGVSAWWKALHAGGQVVLDPRVAAIVAGAPPVILGLAYHLLRMVSNTHGESEDSGGRANHGDGALAVPQVAHPYPQLARDHAHGAAHTNGDGRDVAAPRKTTIKERAWQWYQRQREQGHNPTAPQLAREVDTSPGNARKLIAEFRLRWPDLERPVGSVGG